MKDLVQRRRLAYRDDGGGSTDSVAAPEVRRPGAAGHRINPTVSTAVIAEAQNALEAAHTSGDYRFQCVGDLIRAALQAHAGGLRITQQARSGRKKRHTVELPPALFEHYEGMPSRSRGVIVERSLLSFLAQGFERQG